VPENESPSLLFWYTGEEATEDGVVGVFAPGIEYWRERFRKGEAGRRLLGTVLFRGRPNVGELLLSSGLGVSSSSEIAETLCQMSTGVRLLGGNPGKTSSAGFLGVLLRCGEPAGLEGRFCGVMNRWPAAFTPGMDCARDIGGARALAVDLDLIWPRESGDVLRGRYGKTGDDHPGEIGDEGVGSVERRMVGGFKCHCKES